MKDKSKENINQGVHIATLHNITELELAPQCNFAIAGGSLQVVHCRQHYIMVTHYSNDHS
jgi:hypothetical protein